MNKLKIYSSPSILCDDQNFAIPSHMNYGKFVLDKLVENKKSVALINGETDEKVTYGEMAQQVVNTAFALLNLGVKAGDVVGICCENRTEFLTTTIAVNCTEAVVTFLNCAYSKDELIHTLKISKPKYVFLSPNTYKTYYKVMQSLDFINKFFIFGSSVSDGKVMSFLDLAAKYVNIESFRTEEFKGAEKTALILYSSGTTGLPKGAKLSHRNLIIAGLQPFPQREALAGRLSSAAYAVRTIRDLTDKATARSCKRGLISLSVAPWTNTIGIILTMRGIINNETIVYINRFNEEHYLKCIEKYKAGLLLAVPSLLVLLNKSNILRQHNISSVQLIYCGGAPLDTSVIDDAKMKFPNLKHVLQGYGMTESSGAVTEENDHTPRQGSVGRVLNGANVKIVDVETRVLLGPNQPGEVCVKGPAVFQGYVDKDLKEDLDNEGFYCTGDIAYYDENGYLYIVDRIKELIKYKAGQVGPSELEAILRTHPAVKDAGVIGTPDPLAGELPTAFVVKLPGVSVTDKELIDFVGSKVSSWKQLRGGVTFLQEIPKNGSGKILRQKLRAMIP